MKEQILPPLPIVGKLKLTSLDGKTLSSITISKGKSAEKLDPFFNKCFKAFENYLTGKTKQIDLPVDLSGLSTFQLRVLNEMKAIPFGKLKSYKDLGNEMKSKGHQAIGSACGRNPFMLIYPCHRVVGSNSLGGFAHGTKMKIELLQLEKAI